MILCTTNNLQTLTKGYSSSSSTNKTYDTIGICKSIEVKLDNKKASPEARFQEIECVIVEGTGKWIVTGNVD